MFMKIFQLDDVAGLRSQPFVAMAPNGTVGEYRDFVIDRFVVVKGGIVNI